MLVEPTRTDEATIRAELADRRRRLLDAAPLAPDRLAGLLRDVDTALADLEAGTFGRCDRCHDPVERDRLAADPLIRVCLGCLSQKEQRALEYDLELASKIQRQLLPPRATSVGGWETFYHYEPLGAVSGDHCDLVLPPTSGGDLFFLFADVSGKGVAASILMGHLQAAFRTLVGTGHSLVEVLERMNHVFASSTPASSYATLVCGRLTSDGGLELVNAGHHPPLLRRGRTIDAIEASGLPLGLFSDGAYGVRSFELGPGDSLFLYTDGLTDARNEAGQIYDPDRIVSILRSRADDSAEVLTRACLDDLAVFSNGHARSDDLTVMTIRRSSESSGRLRSSGATYREWGTEREPRSRSPNHTQGSR